jgi:thiol-disulfide isomerase/thioredoxin
MKLILVGLLALPVVGMAQKSQPGFTIRGKVAGMADGAKVFVTDASNPTDTVASDVVKGGEFTLKGQLTEPNLYEVNFDNTKKKAPIFLGNDNVQMTGSLQDVAAIRVVGSASNDDFVAFQTTFTPFLQRLNGIVVTAKSSDAAVRDSLFKVYKRTTDSIFVAVDSYIAARRNSYVSPFLLVVVNQLTEDVMGQLKRLRSLSPEVQQGNYAQYLGPLLEKATIGAVGTDALDFTQNDTSGRAVSLSSFKGKYVLVDFWASWCGPCRMENPNVLATYQKFRNKNFTVLGVSLDKAKEPWVKAIKDDGLLWTQVSDLKYWYNDAAAKYHIEAIPQNLLVDPNGKIVARNLRGVELQQKLCELLGCN